MAERFDIIVIGGGPTGLAAALTARMAGRATALVAAATPPDRRTAALLGGSVDLLRRLEAWEPIAAGAAPLRRIRIVDGTARLIRAPEVLFDSAEIGREAFGYNIGNAELTAALDRLVTERGIRRYRARADAIGVGEDAVTVTASDGTVLEAALLIAADGRDSAGRKAADIATREWRYPQSAIVANLSHQLPHGDVSTEFHTESGPFTLVPLAGNRSSLVWVETPDGAERLAARDAAAFALAVERRAQSFLGTMALEGDRQIFPLRGMTAERLAWQRVALVGEAGHVLPPIGAQELNLGFSDVAALSALLRMDDPGAAKALAAYDAARRTDVEGRSHVIDGMNRSLLSDFLPVQMARGLGLFLLGQIPALRRAAMRRGLGAANN